MAVGFVCPSCRKYVEQDLLTGQQSTCPFCGQAIVMEQPQPQGHIFCASCGLRNDENNYRCTGCGFVLRGDQQPIVVTDDIYGGLIPGKNPAALWSYYLGVFSLIPCVGWIIAIFAIVTGIRGLRNVKAHPQIRGKGHAITGLILGSLVLLFNLLIIVLAVIGIMNSE